MRWLQIPHRRRKVMERKLNDYQKGLWKEDKVLKLGRLRALFGGVPHAGNIRDYTHYGIHSGPPAPLIERRAQALALGPDIVAVSEIVNGRFLALWKIPEGERLLGS